MHQKYCSESYSNPEENSDKVALVPPREFHYTHFLSHSITFFCVCFVGLNHLTHST